MTTLFRTFALFLVSWLAISGLTGCGGDGEDEEEEEATPVKLVSATPPNGSCLAANMSITLTFDGKPEDVIVSSGAAAPSGNTVIVNGPFVPGGVSLAVSWADGSTTLAYPLCCCVDPDPPEVTGRTVKDGDKDVDPEAINTDGKIEIIFSEDIAGHIALQTEAGDDVGWIGKVEGNKAILELVKGRELGNETTYVIRGEVSDAAGNTTDVSITFVTKAKE